MTRNIPAARFSITQLFRRRPPANRAISDAMFCGFRSYASGCWVAAPISTDRKDGPSLPIRVLQHLQLSELWKSQQHLDQPPVRPLDANSSEQSGLRRRQRRFQPPIPNRRPPLHPARPQTPILVAQPFLPVPSRYLARSTPLIIILDIRYQHVTIGLLDRRDSSVPGEQCSSTTQSS